MGMKIETSGIIAGYVCAIVMAVFAAVMTWACLFIKQDPSVYLVWPGVIALWWFALWYLLRVVRRHVSSN
jgi:hypothetical protein